MKTILFTLIMMPGILLVAQTKDQMQALAPMVGNWQGDGWYVDPSRNRYEFSQKEEVNFELENTTLLIKGKGVSEGKVIHNAMAIVQYDSAASGYTLDAFLADGKRTKATLEVKSAGSFEWWFNIDQGTIKYFIEIKDETWTEKGAYSPDGQNWYPFIAFTLTKK